MSVYISVAVSYSYDLQSNKKNKMKAMESSHAEEVDPRNMVSGKSPGKGRLVPEIRKAR